MSSWRLGKKQAVSARVPSITFSRYTTGIVKAYNNDGTVQIVDQGQLYRHAFILPRGWTSLESSQLVDAQLDLPPLDSPVFCLLDERGACFVLCGWPLLAVQAYKDHLKAQTSDKQTNLFSKVWQAVRERLTGNWSITDTGDNAKAKLNISKDNSEVLATDFNGHTLIANANALSLESKAQASIKASDTMTLEAPTIELGGNTKELVTHAELDAALQGLLAQIKAHTHVASGPGSPTTPSADLTGAALDLSAAKAAKVKVG